MRVRGTDFNVMVLNEGGSRTVAMIHGIFSNLSVFYMAIAQVLALRYRVVLYDMRGHGLSPATPSGYDVASMSDDLVAILSELGVDRVHLAGYSYGGLVALHTALHHPELVDKLILVETPNLGDGKRRPMLEGYDRKWFEKYLQGCFSSTPDIPRRRRIDKAHREIQYLFDNTTLGADLKRDRDLFNRVAGQPFPHETLLLYATRTDCANAGRFLHRHIARSSLHFGRGDHSIPVQNPGWISDRIIEFL